jgi:hypothetical protein
MGAITPLHDVLDRLTHIGDVYGSLASDLTLHIRRLENGLERPRGRSRPAPRHLASLVAADAFAGALTRGSFKTIPASEETTNTQRFEAAGIRAVARSGGQSRFGFGPIVVAKLR